MIGIEPITFAIDFALMMDRWVGGLVVVDLEHVSENMARVIMYRHLDLELPQTDDRAFILDHVRDGWSIAFTSIERDVMIELLGTLSADDLPQWEPLRDYIAQYGVNYNGIPPFAHSTSGRGGERCMAGIEIGVVTPKDWADALGVSV